MKSPNNKYETKENWTHPEQKSFTNCCTSVVRRNFGKNISSGFIQNGRDEIKSSWGASNKRMRSMANDQHQQLKPRHNPLSYCERTQFDVNSRLQCKHDCGLFLSLSVLRTLRKSWPWANGRKRWASFIVSCLTQSRPHQSMKENKTKQNFVLLPFGLSHFSFIYPVN